MLSNRSSATFSSSESSLSDLEKLNLEEDRDWKDVQSDKEDIKVVSLFGKETFDTVQSMLKHCKDVHHIDIAEVRKELDLDFFGMIKLVNYIRNEVRCGNNTPNLSSKSLFDNEKYLQPILEDDAVLYSLDDIMGGIDVKDLSTTNGKSMNSVSDDDTAGPAACVAELEQKVQCLHLQFVNYRETVNKTLEQRWNCTEDASVPVNGVNQSGSGALLHQDYDSHYFSSYSTNEIHEIMLKDTIRTNAYRNFIYDNKHLFQGKVVLDVGCGTGILSMFCAQAGAAKVLAVDNSTIIDKARENIHENGLGEIIVCLRGKIEEVSLPVPHVDIIVSEWMGYCLLYEAMLDSVLWARNRYLAPDGLMIPSHITLHIAPLADPDYITEHISYWKSVYGFKMTSMLANIYDEVLIRNVKSSALPGDSRPFVELALHSVQQTDTTFSGQPFTLMLTEDIAALDGFVIWFDTFLLPSREQSAPVMERAEEWEYSHPASSGKAFSTGPKGPETHWQQGVLLIDHGKRGAVALKKGEFIRGNVGYKKRKDNPREMDIKISWQTLGSGDKRQQLWSMR